MKKITKKTPYGEYDCSNITSSKFRKSMNQTYCDWTFSNINDRILSYITNELPTEELSLAACRHFTDKALEYIVKLPKLKSLDLSGSIINGSGFSFLANNCLKKIHLYNTRILEENYCYFLRMRLLEYINLSYSHVTSAVMPYLSQLPFLKELILDNNNLTNDIAPYLEKMVALEKLLLSSTSITDELVSKLENLYLLNHLELQYNKITDEGVKNFYHLKELDYLDLGGSCITDISMQVFANCHKLRVLNLWETNITDLGIFSFLEYKGGETLESLDITNCINITEKIVPLLLERFPNLWIVNAEGTQITTSSKFHYSPEITEDQNGLYFSLDFHRNSGNQMKINIGKKRNFEEKKKDYEPLPPERWKEIF
jgi:Leucine-rich repeat (LRR) protein